jgi:hypothetical protein
MKFFKYMFYALVLVLFAYFLLCQGKSYPKEQLSYGVTFSVKQARSLGLDWQEMYAAILDDLGVRQLRLIAYWDEIASSSETMDWSVLDKQVEMAKEKGAGVILAVGRRLPRWPECHAPGWASQLDAAGQEAALFKYIESAVNRYKGYANITAWQVENEPFLPHFGECPPLDPALLDREIALVRSLDSRPVVVTDSGELSVWVPAAKRADIFGTTLYRRTYSQNLKRYIHYPIGPGFFRAKKRLASLFAKPRDWIVIELGAEPWAPYPYQNITKEERSRTMDLAKLKDTVEFARKTGFRDFYLWGVEWWYWEKVVNGDEGLWEYTKTLYQ